MLVDSHCHLNLLLQQVPGATLGTVLEAAKAAQVCHMLCVGTNLENSQRMLSDWQSLSCISLSAGIHPLESLPELTVVEGQSWRARLEQLISHDAVKAVGETGLDLGPDLTADQMRLQREWFAFHLDLAKKYEKPIIIHSRHAIATILQVIREDYGSLPGVLHCFTEDKHWAKQVVDLGLKVSFSGILTFKNADKIREAAQYLPLETILVETDAPYLAPVPFRGKPNHPANVLWVARGLADLKKMAWQDVAEQTTQNFCETFKILRSALDTCSSR